MKTMLMAVIVLVSLVLIPAALASRPEEVAPRHINCCMSDGQCLKTRRHNCEKKGGRVVEDCKTCKAEWDPNKPDK